MLLFRNSCVVCNHGISGRNVQQELLVSANIRFMRIFMGVLCVRQSYRDTCSLLNFVPSVLRESTTPLKSRDYNCDSTTMRLRYDDTTTHSTTTEVIEIRICVRFDCDMTTTRLRRKINMFIFFARVEWKQARATRRSLIVVVS